MVCFIKPTLSLNALVNKSMVQKYLTFSDLTTPLSCPNELPLLIYAAPIGALPEHQSAAVAVAFRVALAFWPYLGRLEDLARLQLVVDLQVDSLCCYQYNTPNPSFDWLRFCVSSHLWKMLTTANGWIHLTGWTDSSSSMVIRRIEQHEVVFWHLFRGSSGD